MDHRNELTPWQIWLLAARPKTLPAAAAPVLVGCALAIYDAAFRPGLALATLLCALLLQVGANLANDVSDFYRGADAGKRLGPMRVTQAGLLTPRQVKTGLAVVFGLAALLGLYIAFDSSFWIIVIGIASILAAVAYTGGPRPYGYAGLGEVFVFLFFGPVAVCGTYVIQVGIIGLPQLLAAVPVGLLVTNILVVNNLRDIESDREAGKHTLSARMGAAWTQREYVVLLVVAYIWPVVVWVLGKAPVWSLLPLISIPMAVSAGRSVFSYTGAELNRVLARTARLALIFSILFTAGMIIATFFVL